MTDYPSLIAETEAEVNALSDDIHRTVAERHKSSRHYERWKSAARHFHAYASPIDDMIDKCIDEGFNDSNDLRAFAFAYIRYDPYYFRSGYIQEKLIQRIKRLKMTPDEKAVIRNVILSRIRNRALRNFRHFCRLIPRIATSEFSHQINGLARSDDGGARHRAQFALSYFPKDNPQLAPMSVSDAI
jgi:uncharacterized membrane protein YheB (UPF0754 family)